MERELVDVRPYGSDWRKLVEDILGVKFEQGGSYGAVEVVGIEFSRRGYGGPIPGIDMSFRDEFHKLIHRGVMVKAFMIDAGALKTRYQELRELFAPVALRRAEIATQKRIDRDRIETVAEVAGLAVSSLRERQTEDGFKYVYTTEALTVEELIAVGKALQRKKRPFSLGSV